MTEEKKNSKDSIRTVQTERIKGVDVMVNRAIEKIMIDNNGIGLAAPQVGIFERFFIMKDFRGPGIVLIINPEIIEASKKIGTFKEGCLTYNIGSNRPTWTVKRPKRIRASWIMSDGRKMVRKLSGREAQVFYHEIQHLEGITVKTMSNDSRGI